MNEELAKDYLTKSGFDAMQAHALSKLLAETATRDDLRDLERRLAAKTDGLETRLRADLSASIAQTRVHLTEAIAQSRVELAHAIASGQTQIMRCGIAMIVAMSSIFTLLDIFIH